MNRELEDLFPDFKQRRSAKCCMNREPEALSRELEALRRGTEASSDELESLTPVPAIMNRESTLLNKGTSAMCRELAALFSIHTAF